MMTDYAEKGYVTINVEYRLTGEAPFPACIEDVKCEVRGCGSCQRVSR